MRRGKRTLRRRLLSGYAVISTLVTAVLVCATAMAASSDGSSSEPMTGSASVSTLATPYELLPGSTFYRGCLGPCLCPVRTVGDLAGTFDLEPITPTPLFTRYSMTNINWNVVDSQGQGIHTITGNGTYEVGGEVALTQQMTLFLSIDGKPQVTFDSGLVMEQTRFPDISVKISHGICRGSWMTINAAPKS